MTNTTFANKAEARTCVEAQPFACGVMFDVTTEHCVGITAAAVVACTATNHRGRKVCFSAAEVAEFVGRFAR